MHLVVLDILACNFLLRILCGLMFLSTILQPKLTEVKVVFLKTIKYTKFLKSTLRLELQNFVICASYTTQIRSPHVYMNGDWT